MVYGKKLLCCINRVSIDKGEIGSLDERVKDYLDYFNDERSKITIETC